MMSRQRKEVLDRLRGLEESSRSGARVVRSSRAARKLLQQQPDCGLSERELSAAVISEAAARDIPVEIEPRGHAFGNHTRQATTPGKRPASRVR